MLAPCHIVRFWSTLTPRNCDDLVYGMVICSICNLEVISGILLWEQKRIKDILLIFRDSIFAVNQSFITARYWSFGMIFRQLMCMDMKWLVLSSKCISVGVLYLQLISYTIGLFGEAVFGRVKIYKDKSKKIYKGSQIPKGLWIYVYGV